MTGSDWSNQYLTNVQSLCADAARAERAALALAANSIAQSIADGRRWWAFGTGHSHLLVEELWGRAGGLVDDIYPILEPSLMLHEGLYKSSLLERQAGLAATLLKIHAVTAGDSVLIISNSGRNAVPVEMAELSRERGATVIALTSVAHSQAVASRAPSGRRLFEVADIVIDNHGSVGDAILQHPKGNIGATSTVVGAMLMQALSVHVIGDLRVRGRFPRTFVSNNA